MGFAKVAGRGPLNFRTKASRQSALKFKLRTRCNNSNNANFVSLAFTHSTP